MELWNALPAEARPVVIPIAFLTIGYFAGRILGGMVVGFLRFLGLYEWSRLPWLDPTTPKEPTPAKPVVPQVPATQPEIPESAPTATAGQSERAVVPLDDDDLPTVAAAVAGNEAHAVAARSDESRTDTPDTETHAAVSPDETPRNERLERLISGLVTLSCVLAGLWFSADILRWEGTRSSLQHVGGFALGALGIAAFAIWFGELVIKPAVSASVPAALRKRLDGMLESKADEVTFSQILQTGLAGLLYLIVILLGAQFAVEIGAWRGGESTIATLWSTLTLFGTLAAVWGMAWALVQLFSSRHDSDVWGSAEYAVIGGAAVISLGFLSGYMTWVLGPALLIAAGFVVWPLRSMIEDRAAGWYLQSNKVREVWFRGDVLELRDIRPCVTEVVDREGRVWCLPNRLLTEALQKGIPEKWRSSQPPSHPPSATTDVHAAGMPLRYEGVSIPTQPVGPESSIPPGEAPRQERLLPSSPLTPQKPVVEWDDGAGGYSIQSAP